MNDQNEFKPFVPAEKSMSEFTPTSIILGIFLAVVFGAANAYLGLRVGMTVSASIPAAVVSMGIIRKILKKESILENNMAQTIGSAGESVAAGAIFTLPALFLWAKEWMTESPSLVEIAIVTFIGGALGVLFMVPLRKALIVREHRTLPYPEGKACAEVLVAGEEGGSKASVVFAGLGIAAAYKFIADGLKAFPSDVHYEIPAYKGAGFGADVLPALLGVGYICGPKISSYLLAGGVMGWFVIMPLIVLFGANITLFPAQVSVADLYASGGSFAIWSNYVKYIGAGAVACGGIISLLKSLPLIVTTFGEAFKGFGKGATPKKQQIGELIGVLASSIAIGGVLYLLDAAWGYGSAELPAPQATLMKLIVEGVMGGNLPWTLVGVGVFVAIIAEILGIPVLPFAIGLYLPIHLSVPMMIGGGVKWLIEKLKKGDEQKAAVENGILYSSGLIAGEGMVGILLAIFAIIQLPGGKSMGEVIGEFLPNLIPILQNGNVGNMIGIVAFAVLTFSLWKFCVGKSVKSSQ